MRVICEISGKEIPPDKIVRMQFGRRCFDGSGHRSNYNADGKIADSNHLDYDYYINEDAAMALCTLIRAGHIYRLLEASTSNEFDEIIEGGLNAS
jgi:hypothetical protein|tara:strand:- start:15378 stop:15662 length:285 start_codon:yes stop_codon:yes gene_type:complete